MVYKNIRYIFLMLVCQCLHIEASNNSLAHVLSQYEEALKDLIGIYTAMKPPKPIQLSETDVVGSAYQKILQPYVIKISGYSHVVMSEFARKFPYQKDLESLATTFYSSQKEVERISSYFPQDMRQDVMIFFYKQLSNSMVQTCTRIVQHISYALDTDSTAVQAAKIAYTLAWEAQTSDMKIMSFANVDDFRKQITSWMVDLCQAAIEQENEDLEKSNNKQDIFEKIVSYYTLMEQVYTNIGDKQQAALVRQNVENAQKTMTHFKQADSFYQQAEQLSQVARSEIVIDFFNPEDTRKNVLASIQQLNKVLNLYKEAEALYQQGSNVAQVTLCQQKQGEIAADEQMRTIQLLWISFLTNQTRTDDASGGKAYAELHAFYRSNAMKSSVSVLKDMVQALSNLEDLCTKAPNVFSSTAAIGPFVKDALQLYQSADVHHVHAHNPDRLANSKQLHALQNCIESFTVLVKGMIEFAGDDVTGLHVIDALVVHAKKIDELLDENNGLKDFFVYFPDFEETTITNKSFVSFLIQYVYRAVMIKTRLYMQGSDQQQDQGQVLLHGLSYMIDLQGYKDNLTTEQIGFLNAYIQQLSQDINFNKLIEQNYQRAKSSQDWTNTKHGHMVYQSSANSSWHNIFYVYEILLQIMPSSQVKKQYLEVLYQYVLAYMHNVTPYVGYQLYIAKYVYMVYEGALDIQNNSLAQSALGLLNELFKGERSFFSEAQSWVEALKAQSGSKQEMITVQDDLNQIVTVFESMVAQQSVSMERFISSFKMDHTPRPLFSMVNDNYVKKLEVSYAENDFYVNIMSENKQKVSALKQTIDTLFSEAEEAEKKQNFEEAAKQYKELEQLYLSLLKLLETDFDKQTYQQKYFLVKTKATACFLLSSVASTGSDKIGSLSDIPSQYYSLSYTKPSINVQLLSSTMPTSLQGIGTLTLLQGQQRIDALALFKAYIVSQILQGKGIAFADCYVNYLLSRKKNISPTNESIMNAIESQVSEYIQSFKQTDVSAEVAGQAITISFKNMPIPAINPLYPTATYAAVYFIGASTLFKPGEQLLHVAGGSYVPGQDQASANVALERLGYAYLSDAKTKLDQAQRALQKVVDVVKADQKNGSKIAIEQFSSLYNTSKQLWVRAQALLFATGSSAYAYFDQGQNDSLADEVKQLFLSTYQQQVMLLPKLLVGNPFSQMYITVLSDLNQLYVSWTSELDPSKDSTRIEENQNAIIDLYVTAAQSCMNYQYSGNLIPQVKQYHYIGAAKDYLSARKEYMAMGNDEQAESLNDKAMQAYFLACSQNVRLYFAAKSGGVVYTPEQITGMGSSNSTKPKRISYNQLVQAYQDFQNAVSVNPGKTKAYTDVKRLLLDAAMFYQYLAGEYHKQFIASNTGEGFSAAKGSSLNPKILSYLQNKQIIVAGESDIQYVDVSVRKKLFGVASDLFVQNINDLKVLSDWCNILNMAVAYQYIDDYLGGVKSSGSQQFKQKWETFFQAVQKESSAFQNPAAAYVG